MSSRRANPKLIGGFVIGAIGLLVAAALVFGSFTFFQTTRRFVMFFEGSVDGLTAGSAVLFRGVPLGRVVDVGIRYDPANHTFEIPVVIEIRPSVIARYSPSATMDTEGLNRLIEDGLRARLESASLVTGQQVVQLNFFPGSPIKLDKTDLPYFQLPTVPSPTQQIMSSVDAAARDLPTLIKEASVVLDRVQGILSPENQAAFNSLLENAASVMKSLQADAESIGRLMDGAGTAVASAGQLTKHLDGIVQDNRQEISATLRNFREATVSANKLVDQLNQIAAANRLPIKRFTEGTIPDLTALIIDARTAVNKATTVLDSIERNPTRFIFGNKMGQGVELQMTTAMTGANRRHIVAGLIMAAFTPSMSACGLGGGPPPPQYTLSPVTGFARGSQPVGWSLVVDEPTAPRQIDTSRIALMKGPFRVDYYADVEWTDNAPAMVQLLLIQSFQNTGRLPVVASTRATLSADLLLLSTLRKFQVENDAAGTPQAAVVLETTLLRLPRREPVATARFEKATPVGAGSIDAVTTAFDTSLGDVIRRVVEWTLAKGGAAERTR